MRDLGRVAEAAGERAGVLGAVAAPGEVLGTAGEQARDPECPGALPGGLGVRVERAVQPVPALAGRSAGVPVEPQGPGQPESGPGLAGHGEAELQGGPQVVLVGPQPGHDLPLPRPEPPPLALRGHLLGPVPLPPPGGRLLPGPLPQLVEPVVPQRVEQAVPGRARAALPGQHGLVHETGHGFEDVLGVYADALAVADARTVVRAGALARRPCRRPSARPCRVRRAVRPEPGPGPRPLRCPRTPPPPPPGRSCPRRPRPAPTPTAPPPCRVRGSSRPPHAVSGGGAGRPGCRW